MNTAPQRPRGRLSLAPSLPPKMEELIRRRKVDELVTRLRDESGPIGVSVVSLMREDRDGDTPDNG